MKWFPCCLRCRQFVKEEHPACAKMETLKNSGIVIRSLFFVLCFVFVLSASSSAIGLQVCSAKLKSQHGRLGSGSRRYLHGYLFDVMIPANSPIGVDVGSFQIQGGATGSAQSVLGNADFDIVVTPEPPSLLLSGTGLFIMAIMCRRVRFSGTRNQKMVA